MVTFTCDRCNESLKKNKVRAHIQSCCRGASVSCIDCGKCFHGNEYDSHTSCVSEAEKYQKALYRPKNNRGPQQPKQSKPCTPVAAGVTPPIPPMPVPSTSAPVPLTSAPVPSTSTPLIEPSAPVEATSAAPAAPLPEVPSFKWKKVMKKILKAAPAATMTLGEFEEAVQARFRDEMMSHFHSAFTETLRRKMAKTKDVILSGERVQLTTVCKAN